MRLIISIFRARVSTVFDFDYLKEGGEKDAIR